MCSSQRRELTIKSSELRGLSKRLGRDFFLWRMIEENIAGCSTFMNDFVVQAQLSVDQLSVCVFGSLYDFVYYLLSPFNEQTYPQRETLIFFLCKNLFRNWMAVLRRTSVRNMSATGNWLAIETLAVGTLYEGQFKLSTQMIKPNCLAPPTKHLTSLKIYPI